MRCVDVIRELSVPTAQSPTAAIADHLAHCPMCAAWVERDAQLSRLWEATRPVEPSAETWDAVWGRVCSALDRAPSDVLPMKRPESDRRRWLVVLGALQAAAAILAVVYFIQPRRGGGPQLVHDVPSNPAQLEPGSGDSAATRPTAVVSIVPAGTPVEIPPGELVVIRQDGDRVKVTDLALNGNLVQVDPNFEGLNSLEAIAD